MADSPRNKQLNILNFFTRKSNECAAGVSSSSNKCVPPPPPPPPDGEEHSLSSCSVQICASPPSTARENQSAQEINNTAADDTDADDVQIIDDDVDVVVGVEPLAVVMIDSNRVVATVGVGELKDDVAANTPTSTSPTQVTESSPTENVENTNQSVCYIFYLLLLCM